MYFFRIFVICYLLTLNINKLNNQLKRKQQLKLPFMWILKYITHLFMKKFKLLKLNMHNFITNHLLFYFEQFTQFKWLSLDFKQKLKTKTQYFYKKLKKNFINIWYAYLNINCFFILLFFIYIFMLMFRFIFV